MSRTRVVVSGMAAITGLGSTLAEIQAGLLAGRSAITRWKSIDTSQCYGKIGGDLGEFKTEDFLESLIPQLPEETAIRAKRISRRAPWGAKLSMLIAIDAIRDARLFDDKSRISDCAVIVAGHNLNMKYSQSQVEQYLVEPDYIDPLNALHTLDTNHGGVVSEVLQTHGPLYTVGGACASGNIALRAAMDEVRYHAAPIALLVAPVFDVASIDLQGMALMGAISCESFNDEPSRASRPWDVRREGFVPAHGAAALVIEPLESAVARQAPIYAEILSAEASSDGNHLPQPSREGQARLLRRALAQAGIGPTDVDFISAHATSTALGDITEIRSIKDAFGSHAQKLRINSPKSLLGHTCWSSATVETVAALLQMQAGIVHRSINIDELDPEVDLDVCRYANTPCAVNVCVKNAFGFGGISSVAIFAKTS